MLIGLMSLPNQLVYIQFHPVTYMTKLNIEMTMATLIARLAQGTAADEYPWLSKSDQRTNGGHTGVRGQESQRHPWAQSQALQYIQRPKEAHASSDEDLADLESLAGREGIHKRTEVRVRIERDSSGYPRYDANVGSTPGDGARARRTSGVEDELPLRYNAGHPELGGGSKSLVIVEERRRNGSPGSQRS